jgi:hypothetical protein
MDILAHGLWAAFGTVVATPRLALSRSVATATVALAVGPDVFHVLPVTLWALFGSGSLDALFAYVMVGVDTPPVLPEAVSLWVNHFHCIMHSGLVAAAITLVVGVVTGSLWFPLLGWWSHILIDVFTHSADFYPSPVLYPLTMRGFDGIAWNTPWFMVLNYASLAAAYAWLWMRRHSSRQA